MKSFKDLSRTQKILTIAAGLLAGGFFIFDDPESELAVVGGYPAENMTYPASGQPGVTSGTQSAYTSPTSSSAAQGEVVLYDKGLQMPMGTYTLPAGWKIVQDIATDPSTNQSIKYQVDMIGPRGELIRALGATQYGSVVGKNFEQSWKQLTISGLQSDFEQISFGALEPDQQAQRKAQEHQMYQRLMSQGGQVQCLRAPFSGHRNGQRFEGVVQLTRMGSASNPNMLGTVTAVCTIGPAGDLSRLIQTKASIDNSLAMNPAYEQRREQIQQGVRQQMNAEHNQRMASSQAAHQQRMADRQAAFDAHQQNMRGMSQIQDANHAQWMNNSRNSSTSAWDNSGYSSHDAYIDGIHGRSTFENPDTGFDINLDGQYDYNYTNGLGEYYRTDDPSFDPNSLQGDWQLIDPRSPNY